MGKNCIYLQTMEMYFLLISSSEHAFFDYVLMRPFNFFLPDPSSPLSFSHDEDRDDDPMPRASPSSSNKG